jgi:hypothetical protein
MQKRDSTPSFLCYAHSNSSQCRRIIELIRNYALHIIPKEEKFLISTCDRAQDLSHINMRSRDPGEILQIYHLFVTFPYLSIGTHLLNRFTDLLKPLLFKAF